MSPHKRKTYRRGKNTLESNLIPQAIYLLIVCALSLVTPLSPARAQVPAVATQGSADSLNTQAQTFGWKFTPLVDIRITQLGLFDNDSNGLADPHDIRFWDSAETLLTSITIPEGTGTTKVAQFRYVDIDPPLTLTASVEYVIGAFYTGTQGGWSD